MTLPLCYRKDEKCVFFLAEIQNVTCYSSRHKIRCLFGCCSFISLGQIWKNDNKWCRKEHCSWSLPFNGDRARLQSENQIKKNKPIMFHIIYQPHIVFILYVLINLNICWRLSVVTHQQMPPGNLFNAPQIPALFASIPLAFIFSLPSPLVLAVYLTLFFLGLEQDNASLLESHLDGLWWAQQQTHLGRCRNRRYSD